MNAKATRMLFAAVALSALAAVLASSAQARIPEGNGTQPPSRTVVDEQQTSQGTELLEPRLARHRSGTFVDAEICAALDRAIRLAIQQCSHTVPIAAKQIRTGTGAALAGPASAEPDNRCYGQLVSGINTTWPWAHFDKEAFPPPPGAIALWVQLFGPDIGVDSVRELQLRFCAEN
jgi:hypothetical protein